MYDDMHIRFLMIAGLDHDVARTNMKKVVLSGHQKMFASIVSGLTCFQREVLKQFFIVTCIREELFPELKTMWDPCGTQHTFASS